jgi:hypothetical protein
VALIIQIIRSSISLRRTLMLIFYYSVSMGDYLRKKMPKIARQRARMSDKFSRNELHPSKQRTEQQSSSNI